MTTPAAPPRVPTYRQRSALPDVLGDLDHVPRGLWGLGDWSSLDAAPGGLLAIVGTRDASPYGERTARRLAAAASRAGLVVVSGLARGVDAAAHAAAVEAGGRTIAILGTGVDVPYPAGHRVLHALVQNNGLVLSESEPGTRAFPGCFPRRNRLIAALCTVTVVVEAGFKSGAINTASQALQLGRTVAAVPGPIDDPRAAGANLLIRDGAQVITDVDDLLTLCGKPVERRPAVEQGRPPSQPPDAQLGELEASLLRILGSGGQAAEDLAFSAGLSVRQVAGFLFRLEMAGLVVRDGAGYRAA